MPASLFQHRLILICPQARVAALNTWWTANVEAVDLVTLWPALNPSGRDTDPVTHRWTSAALQDADLRAILLRVCTIAGTTPPTAGQWSGWTRAQKHAWVVSTRDALFAASGIWLDVCANDGATWNDEGQALAAVGVKRRGPTTPPPGV